MQEGYLAGEYPGGTTTLEGSPVAADIRIAWRSPDQGVDDGLIVARTRSNSSGEWQVLGLTMGQLYDVIGSLEGYQDKIVACVSPVPVNFAFVEDSLKPAPDYGGGMVGELIVVGGLPPYTFTLLDDEPEGIEINFDRRTVTLDGIAELPDGAYYIRAEVLSSNGVTLEFDIPIYVGFNPPGSFSIERTALFRPSHLKFGVEILNRPHWLKVRVEKEGETMYVRLKWFDVNGFADGYRVYRQDDPFDGGALPTPLADIPAAQGKAPHEIHWTDTTAEEGKGYYYKVSTYYGEDEKITDEMFVVAVEAPTEIGEHFQGGVYIGNIKVGSDEYAVIMALEDGDVLRQWKTATNATNGTGSAVDGWANTEAMTSTESLRLAHPAATYCREYEGGGFDDWYLPARYELTLAWTYRSLLADLNMAMNATRVWSSTQDGTSSAWSRIFTTGSENYAGKLGSYRVRPVRRIKLTI